MKKRSVTIAGHSTSITLEDEFWNELKIMAEYQDLSINALITSIDADRVQNNIDHGKATNLSSAIRIKILKELKRT